MKLVGPVGKKKKKSVSFAIREKSHSCEDVCGYVGLKPGSLKSSLKKSSSVDFTTKSDCSKKAVVKRPNNKDVMVTPELPRPRMPPTLKLFPRYFRDQQVSENSEEPDKPKKPSRARLFEEPVKKKADSPGQIKQQLT